MNVDSQPTIATEIRVYLTKLSSPYFLLERFKGTMKELSGNAWEKCICVGQTVDCGGSKHVLQSLHQ